MADGVQRTDASGRKMYRWVLWLLTPSVFPLSAAVALSRGWVSPTGGAWILYDFSRPVSYFGLLVAAGIALWGAIQHTTSLLLKVLMGLSVASVAAMLWYAAHIFKAPY
jgi:hypothetical protein